MARYKLANEKPGQTLQATALVHEAYLRLVGKENDQTWDNRGHFFAAAAEAMRRILVERARRQTRQKHGARAQRMELDEGLWATSVTPDQVLAVDESLSSLAQADQVAADIVKLRYFVGMSIDEAADSLAIHRATAYRHWTYARAWLRAQIQSRGKADG